MAAYRAHFNPRTGLWAVLDENGDPVPGHRSIPCSGEALDHIRDLAGAADPDARAWAEASAEAATALDALLAEAA